MHAVREVNNSINGHDDMQAVSSPNYILEGRKKLRKGLLLPQVSDQEILQEDEI